MLPGQTAVFGGRQRTCDVVSVVYADARRSANGDPVVYWIEHGTNTIWKLEFREANTDPARWTVVLNKWMENQPLPEPFREKLESWVTNEDARLIGKPAPEVAGTMDGSQFRLLAFRGRVVVLDFWATHCGYCTEEMAELEQLRRNFDPEVAVFFSVNQEDPALAARWLADHGQKLPVVFAGPDTAFKAYGVDSLPSIVVIDCGGRVIRLWTEFVRGSKVKQVVNSLLER